MIRSRIAVELLGLWPRVRQNRADSTIHDATSFYTCLKLLSPSHTIRYNFFRQHGKAAVSWIQEDRVADVGDTEEVQAEASSPNYACIE
jgi:hypothetical protein